ncbi:MAG TPA: TolC family protein [Candidatus Dormibacteraeota bacterium]|nr:TolC family protein [Candidatus Dormibacteraeota bacterium]
MKTTLRYLGFAISVCLVLPAGAVAQNPLSWQDVRDKFEASNPTLRAGQIGIEESRAAEITAHLRPNPQTSLTYDQIGNTDSGSPLSASNLIATVSYLHERRHKRELRLESAQNATQIAVANQSDLERTLIFSLRTAFVQTLQEKQVRDLARENLSFYDRLLGVHRDRYKAGGIAQVDLDRLELQRVQYESDLQTAEVNLRTAKIQLLALLNEHSPVDQFDVTGIFDFSTQIPTLEELRQTALENRPDLKAAMQATEKAKSDHRLAVANGSTDPTITVDAGFPSISQTYLSYNPPLRQYVGVGVSIPLKIFDRNQGEKLRAELDIHRNEKLSEVARAQVFKDVDSAYATVTSTVSLLQPYKDRYLQQASRIRDTISFSYEHGAASLLDFLSAQADYRSVQVNYLNLVASYLSAASQLNLAVGREVIQ